MEMTAVGRLDCSPKPFYNRPITVGRLYKRGFESLLPYYEKVAPHLNKPPPDIAPNDFVFHSGEQGCIRERNKQTGELFMKEKERSWGMHRGGRGVPVILVAQ